MAGVNSSNLTTALDELTWADRDAATTGSKTRGSSELGKEEFLKLLVTQLQNQDPLNPQSDTEFISQLAQFSSLEQMSNLNSAFANSSAYSMVGKEVIVQEIDSAGRVTEVQGTVDFVEIRNGEAYLSINGKSYSMDDLVMVMDTYYAVQAYLPSIEQQTLDYDAENSRPVKVRINLGKNGYEASSVAVVINGQIIDKDYLSYSDGVLTISPEILNKLGTGSYYVGFYFDDPFSTTITDKVVLNIKNDNPATEEPEEPDAEDPENSEAVNPDEVIPDDDTEENGETGEVEGEA
ncbi:MAG: hypothetical protein J1F22_03315 [Lachnospiraceae bacterium]|nr:hypothetical protein [Lachnospiraceae bacterium]